MRECCPAPPLDEAPPRNPETVDQIVDLNIRRERNADSGTVGRRPAPLLPHKRADITSVISATSQCFAKCQHDYHKSKARRRRSSYSRARVCTNRSARSCDAHDRIAESEMPVRA